MNQNVLEGFPLDYENFDTETLIPIFIQREKKSWLICARWPDSWKMKRGFERAIKTSERIEQFSQMWYK